MTNGFGVWTESEGTEVYGNLVYFNGWQAPDRPHGHGIYTQNRYAVRRIADNISFDQFSHGIHAYGSDAAYLDNITIEGNIAFNSGTLGGSATRDILLGGGRVAANAVVRDNATYGISQVNMGYGAGCTNGVLTGHDLVGSGLTVVNCTPTFTGNRVVSIYSHGALPQAYPNNQWYAAPARPTGTWIRVRPNAYEAGRANVAVFNWDRRTTVDVDLTASGLRVGEEFEVRNAQDFFGAPVLTGVYDGRPVALPMTGLGLGTPVGNVPVTPRQPGPDFAAFVVLSRSPANRPAATLTASPAAITAGQSATLSWSTTGATSITIQPVPGAVGASGSASVQPAATTTYTLTARNAAGQTTIVSTTVTVNAAPPAPPPPTPTPLTLTSLSPTSGPTTGGTVLTLRGTGFLSGATVRLGGAAATAVTVASASEIRATTPVGAPGAVNVQVTNPGGATATLASAFTFLGGPTDDTDGDGLPNTWEAQFGLDPASAAGVNGAAGDPDGDGATNAAEYRNGTHPRGSFTRYLAEGTVNGFFNTRIAIANHQASPARVLCSFVDANGNTIRHFVSVPARSRRTVDARAVPGLDGASFATTLESDLVVALDRLMSWNQSAYGAHAESAVERPSTTWFFAEGATGGPFELFYLLLNPNDTAASVRVRYLRTGGRPPIVKTYTVAPRSRFTIWVDNEDPGLAATDVAGEITSTNGVAIIAERSMYLNTPRGAFKGGHNSAGATAAANRWFLAEGSTASFFSMYVLIANPSSQVAAIRATYMRDGATPIYKTYWVGANSRYTVNVSTEDPALADTSLAVQLESTNNVPVVVERTMWWPATQGMWTEGHNAFGSTRTGQKWLLAEGELGGQSDVATFVLVANTGAADTQVRVTLLYENAAEESAVYTVRSKRRLTVPLRSAFPAAVGRRFSVLVENLSSDAVLVVERAMYWNTADEIWSAGSNALGSIVP